MSNLQWVPGNKLPEESDFYIAETVTNANGIKTGHVQYLQYIKGADHFIGLSENETVHRWLLETESPSSIEGEEKTPRWASADEYPYKSGRYYVEYSGGISGGLSREMFYYTGNAWLTGGYKIERWLAESPSPALPVKEEEKKWLVAVPKPQFSKICHDYWLGEDGNFFAYSTDEGDRMPELPVEFYQLSNEPIGQMELFYASDRKSIHRNKWNSPAALKIEFPFYYRIVASTDKDLGLPPIDSDLIGEYIENQKSPSPSPDPIEQEKKDEIECLCGMKGVQNFRECPHYISKPSDGIFCSRRKPTPDAQYTVAEQGEVPEEVNAWIEQYIADNGSPWGTMNAGIRTGARAMYHKMIKQLDDVKYDLMKKENAWIVAFNSSKRRGEKIKDLESQLSDLSAARERIADLERENEGLRERVKTLQDWHDSHI